tara:strand:+ start:2341 stop:8130 length:5790 start_codon:yes stop_codon:yes gene_type:complete
VEELKALYESYIAQGLLSSETTFEQFLNADDSIKESLHKQGVDSKVVSNQTDLETFKSAWGDVKKKDSDLPVQEEVTESITEVETPDASLDSSEKTVELEEPEGIPDPVDTQSKVLSELQINPEEFNSWKEENLRPESKAYDFFKNILLNDEGEQFEDEEKIQKQVSSFLANKLNKNLELIDASDDASRQSLIEQNKKDSQTLLNNLKSYNKEVILDEREDRRKLLERQERGLLTRGLSTGLDVLKSGANAAVKYSMGVASSLFAEADALLTSSGFEKKGALAGISETFLDAAQAHDLDFGQVKRSAITQGKEVMYEGKEYIVSDTGVIYDKETNIRVDDIIPEGDVIQIARKAALTEGDFTNTNIELGSSLTGIAGTLVNLYGLIKNSKGVSKSLGVNPKLGMGLVSFSSTVADNMASVKDDLMAQGLSETDANDKAVVYGNSISTLDGLFSALAGSNEKLLGSTKIVKDALFDLAKKKGKDFSIKQLKDKSRDLIKENAKELFIEEIPVLLSEKGINSLINYTAGVDARSGIEDLKRADVYETILLTVGATTGIGSKKLLTNNQRNDIVRQLAQNTDGLEKAGTKLVDDGLLTKEEAAKTINEVKAMEYAEAKTAGAVKITDNMLEAAALITKKEQLIKEKEKTDPSLAGDIDNRIAAVDKQLEQIKAKDDADVKAIINEDSKTKEEVQEPSVETEEEAVIKDSQIPTSKEIYTIETEEGEGVRTVEVTTNKDGSRTIVQKVDGVVAGSENLSKDNTLETKGYVESAYDNIVGEAEVLAMEEVMNPKMKDKLTTKQKQELGIDEEITIQDSQIPTSKEIYNIETEEGEGSKTVEITINKDGSRSVVQKVDGAVASSDNIPAANTLNNNEYVEGSFGPIVGEVEVVVMEDIMSPAMKKKLTNQQKQELGIDKDVVVETPPKTLNTIQQDKKAESLKKRINKISKSPDVEGTVAQSVKQFLRINPRTVSDIDAYISQAEAIVEGLKKSKAFKGDVKVAESVDIKKVDEYSSNELKVQEQTLREQEAKAFEELTGLSSEELSLGEMREILNSVDEESVKTPKEIKLKAEKKADIIAKGIKKAFSTYSAIIKKQIKTGIDPFTGEQVKISANDQEIIQNFLNVDLDNLSPAEQLKALDALTNFATNQTTGGMNATISQDKGVKEAIAEEKKGLVAKSLRFFFSKSLSQEYLKNFAQFPIIQEFMFRSQEKAKRFSKASGFTGVTKGVAKADKEANQVFDNYFKKFYKKSKPNGQAFNTPENDVERGMFAFMRRTVNGTTEEQQQEFKRRKGLIKQSIDKLKQTGETNDNKRAKVYEGIYNKILKGANNVNDVDSKVDPLNKEAVDWVTNEWASRREELADISLNVYNRILGKDINYTPDSFTLVETPSSEQNIGDPIFEGTSEVIYDKETGVLKPKKPSFNLPENRIINLGFDSQNSKSLGAALTDIYTAESIQQLKGFVNSDAYSKIIPNKSDRDLVTEKFKKYIASKRGVDFVKYSKFVNGLNKFGSLNVGRALGGPTQFLKQLVPLVSTLINSGPVSTTRGMTLLMNPAVNKFLNNSGYGIANRGLQSLSFLESNNSKIENAAKTKFGKAYSQLNKVNQAYLQAFVANPDKLAARASWLAYYTKSLKKQGINPSGIDWNTHKINEEAADFAEQQVGRQQNVSDVDLQGDIFNSKKPYIQVFRKVMLPFANFVLNQKVRMVSDVTMLTSKMSTTQDKAAAARSIGGLAAETALFNSLGLLISEMLEKFTLEDDDEETKEKSQKNRRKGRAGNIVKDVLSPLPLVDVPTVELANYVLRLFAEEEPEEEIQLSTSKKTAKPDKKEPFQLFSEDRKEFLDQLGVLGITGKNAVVVYDLGRMAYKGEYQKKYKGEEGKVKKIDPKYKDAAKINFMAYLLYSIGLLPSDVSTVVKGNIKDMQREKKEIKLSTSR